MRKTIFLVVRKDTRTHLGAFTTKTLAQLSINLTYSNAPERHAEDEVEIDELELLDRVEHL